MIRSNCLLTRPPWKKMLVHIPEEHTMKSKIPFILLVILCVIGVIGCEEVAPSTGGQGGTPSTKVARIYGVVADLVTFNPVFNAVVYRTAASFIESTRTNANGQFVFEVNLNELEDISTVVKVHKHGYVDRLIGLFLHAD